MAGARNAYYFGVLNDLFTRSYESAELCSRAFVSLDFEIAAIRAEEIRLSIADTISKLRAKLTAEFIAPIDRSDILLLAQRSEKIAESVCHTCRLCCCYRVKKVPRDTAALAALCRELARLARSAMEEFCGKKELCDSLPLIESHKIPFDRLYRRAISELFSSTQNSVVFFTRLDVLRAIKKTCELCFDIPRDLSLIILRNS